MANKIVALLFLAITLPSLAQEAGKEVRTFDGYTLEVQRPCSDFQRAAVCFPETLPATIYDQSKRAIATVTQVPYADYHPFEVHGENIFWLKQIGNTGKGSGKPGKWTNQLWAKNMPTGAENLLFDGKGIDFRVSPNGRFVALYHDDKLYMLDRQTNASSMVAGDKNVTLLEWSGDGSRFWIGAGTVGGWGELGIVKDTKVTWFPYEGGRRENLLEPDRGWLISSDAPLNLDVESEEAFKRSNTIVKLMVVDVFSGKRATLAEAPANYFEPFWDSAGFLRYSIHGQVYKLSKDQIAQKLK